MSSNKVPRKIEPIVQALATDISLVCVYCFFIIRAAHQRSRFVFDFPATTFAWEPIVNQHVIFPARDQKQFSLWFIYDRHLSSRFSYHSLFNKAVDSQREKHCSPAAEERTVHVGRAAPIDKRALIVRSFAVYEYQYLPIPFFCTYLSVGEGKDKKQCIHIIIKGERARRRSLARKREGNKERYLFSTRS